MMIKYKYFGIALMVLALASCGGGGGGGDGGGGSDSPTAAAAQSLGTGTLPQTCVTKSTGGSGAYYQHGNYIVSSNVWNPGFASSYTECVNATISSPGGVSAEFDWNFTPTSSNGTVLSYPNIQYGQQSGYSPSTTPALPAPISHLPSLMATGSIVTTCQSNPCYYDSGFDIFLSQSTPAPKSIQGELMIITGWNFSQPLGGSFFAATNVPIDGVLYNVRVTNGSWPYVAYYPVQQPITTMSLNIAKFVGDAFARGYFPSSLNYLDMVELGTEVIAGQGKTVISNFQVQ